MPRLGRYLALFLLLAIFFALPAAALPPDAPTTLPTDAPGTTARAMALLDVHSGRLLAAQNAEERLPMASTTKIMTALVAIEHLPLERTVTVPQEAVGIEGSSIYLYAGEQITVQTLLYGLLLSSANDAAVALALEVGGSIPAFAEKMNEKAHTLGLFDTHFCNPNGLHEKEHYTTAKDLARLTAAALSNDVFAEIVSTRRYSAPQNGTNATRLFLNHNRLLRTYEGAIGVKTGFTKAAGRCLVSAATREELTLVCVTLSCPDDWRDHTALLDFGFAHYERVTPTLPALTLPVVAGNVTEVALYAPEIPSFTLPRHRGELRLLLELPRFLYGGFAQGKEVGRLIYCLDGIRIGEIPLCTATASAPEKPLGFWAKMKRFFQG